MAGPSHTPPVGGSYLGLLRRNRDFRLLYLASIISMAGDWFLTVALLDLVLELTGRAALATLVAVVMNLPVFLAAPWVGTLVDKLDRRKLMIFVDLVRTGAALLPLLATTPGRLVFAYVGVCIISAGTACFDPAADAALPNLVTREDLGRANALFSSAWGTMMAAGATLGGLCTVYLGRTASFAVNALSFLVSAMLLLFIRAPFSETEPEKKPQPPIIVAMREALRYARGQPRVLSFVLGKTGYGLMTGMVALLTIFGQKGFLGGPSGARGIAILLSARGLGALLGPFVLRMLVRSNEYLSLAAGPCILLFCLGYMGLAQGSGIWLGGACILFAHMGGAGLWMATTYGLQREVPDELRGRVLALDYGLLTLAVSLSSLFSGVFADRYGTPPVMMALSTLGMLWAGGWLLLSWRLFLPRK